MISAVPVPRTLELAGGVGQPALGLHARDALKLAALVHREEQQHVLAGLEGVVHLPLLHALGRRPLGVLFRNSDILIIPTLNHEISSPAGVAQSRAQDLLELAILDILGAAVEEV